MTGNDKSEEMPNCPVCEENTKVKCNGPDRHKRQNYYCNPCKHFFYIGERERAKRKDSISDSKKEEIIKTFIFCGFIRETAKEHKISRYTVERILFEKAKVVELDVGNEVYLSGIRLRGVNRSTVECIYNRKILKQRIKQTKKENLLKSKIEQKRGSLKISIERKGENNK